MLTEQVKTQVIPFEIKDKYMDEWNEINVTPTLAEKCDKYENISGIFMKQAKKYWEKRPFQVMQRSNNIQNSRVM